MSATEDEVIVEIKDEAEKPAEFNSNPPDDADAAVSEADPAPEAPVVKPEEGLAKLQAQLATEKRAREDAERRATDAANSEARALAESQNTNKHLIDVAISNSTQALDALEAKQAQAYAEGDFAGAAKVGREIGRESAKLLQLEQGKEALSKAPPPQPRAPADPLERFIAERGITPTSAQWLRTHPECISDAKLNRKMLRAHEDALDEGLKGDTPEYFAHLEKSLGFGHTDAPRPKTNGAAAVVDTDDHASTETASNKAAGGRNAAPAAAPVTRGSTGTGGAKNGRTITLSAAEREMALLSFPTAKTQAEAEQMYAKQKAALIKEGKLN